MSDDDKHAFVGDIHGQLDALLGLWSLFESRQDVHVVFLGDYVNKGDYSAEVMHHLVGYAASGRATLLLGNHEAAFAEALSGEGMGAFLRMGGAKTIRSYVKGRVGPRVLDDLTEAVPASHVAALQSMPLRYELPGFLAQHKPTDLEGRFTVSAHETVGNVPAIGPCSAKIDTGCGGEGGRLTTFLWPSRRYLQVDNAGAMVTEG